MWQKNFLKIFDFYVDLWIWFWYYLICADLWARLWRGIEVVITRRSWKPFVRKGAWVRIPSSPRGTFESNIVNDSSFWRSTQEVEETPLERVQVVNSGARVQIPPSPFGMFSSTESNWSGDIPQAKACVMYRWRDIHPNDFKHLRKQAFTVLSIIRLCITCTLTNKQQCNPENLWDYSEVWKRTHYKKIRPKNSKL